MVRCRAMSRVLIRVKVSVSVRVSARLGIRRVPTGLGLHYIKGYI